MLCPSCKSNSLKPVKLQPGLAARECVGCQGVLVDLLSYRQWLETRVPLEQRQAPRGLSEVEDTSRAMVCPKCSKIMLKYRMAGETSNKVDVCSHCDEAWLDKGEWELLGELRIQHKLNAIFTDPWQRNIREESASRAREERFREALGEESYARLVEFSEWAAKHPEQVEIVRYLSTHLVKT